MRHRRHRRCHHSYRLRYFLRYFSRIFTCAEDNLQQHQERYNTNVLHGRRSRGQPLQGDVSSVADGSSPSSAASTGMATSKSNKIKAKKGETRSASNSDMLAELVHNDTPSTSSPTGGGGRASNRHGRRRRSSTSRRRPSLIQRQTDAALSSASNRHRRRRSSTSCRPSLLIQQKNAASGAGAESDGDDSGGSGFSDDEELRSETNAKMKAKAKAKAKRQWESSKKLIPLVNMGHNYRARFRGNAAHDGALQIQRCVRGWLFRHIFSDFMLRLANKKRVRAVNCIARAYHAYTVSRVDLPSYAVSSGTGGRGACTTLVMFSEET